MSWKNLIKWFYGKSAEAGALSVGSQTPFYLAYHEENNSALLARYGALCNRLMEAWINRQSFTFRKNDARRIIRIGIVSAQIYDHPVWNAIVKGWIEHLDRDKFEICIIYLGTIEDKETAWARDHSARFLGWRERAVSVGGNNT